MGLRVKWSHQKQEWTGDAVYGYPKSVGDPVELQGTVQSYIADEGIVQAVILTNDLKITAVPISDLTAIPEEKPKSPRYTKFGSMAL